MIYVPLFCANQSNFKISLYLHYFSCLFQTLNCLQQEEGHERTMKEGLVKNAFKRREFVPLTYSQWQHICEEIHCIHVGNPIPFFFFFLSFSAQWNIRHLLPLCGISPASVSAISYGLNTRFGMSIFPCQHTGVILFAAWGPELVQQSSHSSGCCKT